MADVKKKYRIQAVEEEKDKLEVDPLEQLPDVSAQTGGLPIVTFILICLSACMVLLIGRALGTASWLVRGVSVPVMLILLFGILALIRGMFVKLHRQKEQPIWYAVSAIVMAVGVLAGLVIGIVVSF